MTNDGHTFDIQSEGISGGVAADEENERSNWGTRLVLTFLYPFALIAAPVFLLALLIYFVVTAFMDGGIGTGIRSVAAALIPLMVLTFIIQYNKSPVRRISTERAEIPSHRVARSRLAEWLRSSSDPSKKGARALVFIGSLAAGALVMSTLQLSTTIPIGELVASGAFSVLVGSLVTLEKEHYIIYYFGFILGVLGFVTLLGGKI
jgi:hypothetical protein